MGTKGITKSFFEIDVQDTNVTQVTHDVERAISGPSTERWLRGDASEWFADDIESRFNEEGDAKSGFWEPLTDTTIRIRESLGYGPDPINHRTGELEDFATHGRGFLGGADWSEMQVPGSAPDPITARKLKTAQQGSNNNPRGFGPTPPRPVLAFSEMDAMTLLISLERHVIYTVIGHTTGAI